MNNKKKNVNTRKNSSYHGTNSDRRKTHVQSSIEEKQTETDSNPGMDIYNDPTFNRPYIQLPLSPNTVPDESNYFDFIKTHWKTITTVGSFIFVAGISYNQITNNSKNIDKLEKKNDNNTQTLNKLRNKLDIQDNFIDQIKKTQSELKSDIKNLQEKTYNNAVEIGKITGNKK